MKNETRPVRSFLLWTALCAFFWLAFWLFERFLPKAHYYAQFLAFFGIVTTIPLLRAFGRLFSQGPFRPMLDKVSRSLRKLTARVKKTLSRLGEKVRKALGITADQRIRGKDERSFVWGRRKNDVKERKDVDRLHWNELTTNRDRLRFVYVRFVKQSGKRGYRYHPSATPKENGHLWKLPEGTPEHDLFTAYTDARFAPEGERLNDEELEVYADLVGKKTKK